MGGDNESCPRGQLSPLIVQSIIESMALGVMVIDPDGHIIVVNEALSQVLGYPRDEMLRKGWGQLFIDSERNIEFNQVFIDVIWKEMVNLQRTVPYIRPDSSSRILTLTTSFLRAEGSMEGIILLVEDVTETVRMHQREREMFSAMNQLHTERNEGLNKLALSVAHQIRNPMMTIGGFASLMRRNSRCDDRDHEYLDIIREELEKLEKLVSAVVEYASITSAEKQPVRVREVLNQAMDNVRQRSATGARLEHVQIKCPECSMQGDLDMLARAVEEVLRNALDATVESSGIELLAHHDDGTVLIDIEDKGAGIKEEYMPYVFDPFFTTRTDRVGMGLCLAKRIVLEHQGTITIKSEPGIGCRVTLQLPRE